jgi:hypothetical protein
VVVEPAVEVHRARDDAGGDPGGARERREEHGVLVAVAAARREGLARARHRHARRLLHRAVDPADERAGGRDRVAARPDDLPRRGDDPRVVGFDEGRGREVRRERGVDGRRERRARGHGLALDAQDAAGDPLARRIVRDRLGRGPRHAEREPGDGARVVDPALERDPARRDEVERRERRRARDRALARHALEREAERAFLAEHGAVGREPDARACPAAPRRCGSRRRVRRARPSAPAPPPS